MSHFSILVIGEDYEAQLAPFHEFGIVRRERTRLGDSGSFGLTGTICRGEPLAMNEQDKTAWARAANELIEGLPEDTLLTLVDCHI